MTESPTGQPADLRRMLTPSAPGRPGQQLRLTGTVIEGVEAGCVVLVDDHGAVLATVLGFDSSRYSLGSKVEITGQFDPDMMSFCQQGQLFKVSSVAILDEP